MKLINNNELLQLQLDILRNVDCFCRDNDIEYFLVGGTAIGAMRHGGYIPWDDDIDIGMTRPNYQKFISTFNGIYPHLKVYAPEIDWEYYAPYANVCDTRTLLIEGANGHRKDKIGVKIDIFPYDAIPNDTIIFEKIRKESLLLNDYCYVKRHNMRYELLTSLRIFCSYLFMKILLWHFSYSTLQRRIHNLALQASYNDARFLEKIVFPYPDNKPCKKELFEAYCDIQFENLTVRNLVYCDEYLKSIFGNYMQMPPEEERIPHHNFVAYWK